MENPEQRSLLLPAAMADPMAVLLQNHTCACDSHGHVAFCMSSNVASALIALSFVVAEPDGLESHQNMVCHSTIQHGTARRSTAQHSTAQHSTAQRMALGSPDKDAGNVGNACKHQQHKHGEGQACCHALSVILPTEEPRKARPYIGACHDPGQDRSNND